MSLLERTGQVGKRRRKTKKEKQFLLHYIYIYIYIYAITNNAHDNIFCSGGTKLVIFVTSETKILN